MIVWVILLRSQRKYACRVLFVEESFLTVSVAAEPKFPFAFVPFHTVASLTGWRAFVLELSARATCNSKRAQSIPASPCTATFNCPFVSRFNWVPRSSTRTVVFVPVPIGNQLRLENVKLLLVLPR